MTKQLRIQEVLDLQTGIEKQARDFLSQDIGEIFKHRYQLESDIREKNYRYVCYFCKQPLKIRGKRSGTRAMHFAHLRDSDDCPIKTGSKYTKAEIQRIKYNGAKESSLHHDLKHKIAQSLQDNQKSKGKVSDIRIEKVIKHKAIPNKWKKPDVSAQFGKHKVAFELQLSTTFLSEINSRQEFYRSQKMFILWIFHRFEQSDDKRKFMQSDIYYNNNRNGFEFNTEAQRLSGVSGDLVLCCHYERPVIVQNEIKSERSSEYVKLSDLTFDTKNYSLYYYNYEQEHEELQEQLQLSQSSLLRTIKEGSIDDLFNLFNDHFPYSELELSKIKSWYRERVIPLPQVSDNSFEIRIIWALALNKLNSVSLPNKIYKDHRLKRLVEDILSIKTGKVIGYDYGKLIQVIHQSLMGREKCMDIILLALKTFNKSHYLDDPKILKKIERIRRSEIRQISNHPVVNILFPEILGAKPTGSITPSSSNPSEW